MNRVEPRIKPNRPKPSRAEPSLEPAWAEPSFEPSRAERRSNHCSHVLVNYVKPLFPVLLFKTKNALFLTLARPGVWATFARPGGGGGADDRPQGMEWTGSIRWIHNPVQSRQIWIGMDQKFTNSADPGLVWIQICAMCIPYLETWGSFSLSYLWRLKFCPQIFSYTHRRLCLHVDFTRYLVHTYSVVSGLDWTGFRFWVISWIGLD